MLNHYDQATGDELNANQDALLQQLCISVLPLWADQIDAAKTLTNASSKN